MHLDSVVLCKVHVIYMVHSSLYALIWLIYPASEMYEMLCILCIKQANYISLVSLKVYPASMDYLGNDRCLSP